MYFDVDYMLHTLCSLDDIHEGQSKGFQIDDLFLFAVKKNDQIYLYKNACPHLGIQLEWQADQFLDSEQQHIQCCMHGALFNIKDGLCIFGPCQGESLESLPYQIVDDQLCFEHW